MNEKDRILSFLKAIYLTVLATALILIGYLSSGGVYSTLSTCLFVLGGLLLLAGIITSVSAFPSGGGK